MGTKQCRHSVAIMPIPGSLSSSSPDLLQPAASVLDFNNPSGNTSHHQRTSALTRSQYNDHRHTHHHIALKISKLDFTQYLHQIDLYVSENRSTQCAVTQEGSGKMADIMTSLLKRSSLNCTSFHNRGFLLVMSGSQAVCSFFQAFHI